MMDRKARVREYKETPRPAGLFFVRNKTDGTRLIGRSKDLPGMLNRQRFQLEMGSHPDKSLQNDWNELGPDAFEIGVLDELEQPTESGRDITEDLQALHQTWLERLEASGERLYPTSDRGAR